MLEIDKEVLKRIKDLDIECPECEDMYSDDQYTCTTCWAQGGQGRISVIEWIKDNEHLLKDES